MFVPDEAGPLACYLLRLLLLVLRDPHFMLQILLNGTIQGSLFALLALAFAMVYATTRVFYFALGAIFALAPYLLTATMALGAPWLVAVLPAVAGAALVGIGCEAFIHWPLEKARASVDVHFVASLGAFLLIGQVIVMLWGSEPRVLRSGVDLVYEGAGMRLTRGQLLQFVVCTACLASMGVWLRRSETGLRFRALASNAALMSILGTDVRRLRREIFALSGALTAVAALTASFDVGFDPNIGMRAVLVAVAATIVGGRTSLGGAVVAGVMLGILRSVVVWYTSARWEDAVTFGLLAGVLVFLPRGIGEIGKAARLEQAQ